MNHGQIYFKTDRLPAPDTVYCCQRYLLPDEVVAKHALRNSMIPIVTIIGPMAVDLMVGSLVVENIFAIPGIGEQFVKSITTNDYPVIMGLTILYSAMLTVVILVVDILYGFIDPRIRLSGEAN